MIKRRTKINKINKILIIINKHVSYQCFLNVLVITQQPTPNHLQNKRIHHIHRIQQHFYIIKILNNLKDLINLNLRNFHIYLQFPDYNLI